MSGTEMAVKMNSDAVRRVLKSIFDPCFVPVTDDMVTQWSVGGLAQMDETEAMEVAGRITCKLDRTPLLRDFQAARDIARGVETRVFIPPAIDQPTDAEIARRNLAEMRASLK